MKASGLLPILCSVVLSLSSCAHTSVAMLDNSKYSPTSNVEVLLQKPSRPYKQIALLEARGAVGVPITDLIASMQEQAKAIGADAVIPTADASENVAPGLIYNPWIGGYQTIGGGRVPILRGLAIKYTEETDSGTPIAAATLAPGTWSGTITSKSTGEIIKAKAFIKPDGQAAYVGSNGVQLVATLTVSGNSVSGTGTMYMPTDSQGNPLGVFPNGQGEVSVSISGQVTNSRSFSGIYSGGGDNGLFDLTWDSASF
jgi:hypothetical protein